MDKQLVNSKKEYKNLKTKQERISNTLSKVRLIIFFIFLSILLVNFKVKLSALNIFLWLVSIVFIIVAIYHSKVENKIRKYNKYLDIIKNYEERSNGNWKKNQSDQEEVTSQFMTDLDVIGRNSLFQFINFTNSLGGKNKLLDKLSLKNISKKSIETNQKAISELKNNFNFSLKFQEKLSKIDKIKNIDYKDYLNFFDQKTKSNFPELIVSLIISVITIIISILTALGTIKSYYLVGLIILQLITSYFYVLLYKEDFNRISKCARKYSDLKEIYSFIENQKFTSSKNQELQNRIKKGHFILNKLSNIADLDSYRNNFITYLIFNIFASLNFIILYKYISLLNDKSIDFKNSIKALEEFEVLISLTTIGYVKENISIPKIVDKLTLSLSDIKHPLLTELECVSNDFSCNQDINIITGSNMSGKTSFMRTIGINLILAYCGSYVTANTFTCPIMTIFTSINVKDDISNGISTFYGELKRIKAALDYSKNSNEPFIIFIDEIFKGTNYNDRILGAKETLKKLSNLKCIVFLTTHDFELCEINNKKIHNYHFKETYQENKILFDYKIKEGECTTTNAKYLMKQMNIID